MAFVPCGRRVSQKSVIALLIALSLCATARFGIAPAAAQDPDCMLPPSLSDPLLDVGKAASQGTLTQAVVRVHVWIIRPPGSAGRVTPAQVTEDLVRSQPFYAPQVYFQLLAIEELVDGTLAGQRSDAIYDAPGGPFSSIPSQYRHTDRLDVFVTYAGGDTGGFGVYSGAELVVAWTEILEPTFTLAHELGHTLGLEHTHRNSVAPLCAGGWDPCEIGGSIPPDSTGSAQYCAERGDFVCDTPLATCRFLSSPPNCTYPGTGLYCLPARPDTLNIMNNAQGGSTSCRQRFTPGQFQRMLACIEFLPVLQAVVAKSIMKYENKSAATAITFAGTPYSVLAFQSNADTLLDVMVANKTAPSELFRQQQLNSEGVPVFTQATLDAFLLGEEPQLGLRGLSAGDYNTDGRVDVFCAAASNPRLYRLETNNKFTDKAYGVNLQVPAANSWMGAFGDYDADGALDLLVGIAQGGGQDPDPTNLTNAQYKLFWQDRYQSGHFIDKTSTAGLSLASYPGAVTASWADVDGDKDLDLFIGDLLASSGPGAKLFLNNGALAFTDGTSRIPAALRSVSASVWTDSDSDGDLDLVVAEQKATTGTPRVFTNDGLGYFAEGSPLPMTVPALGLRPFDHDLDGKMDFYVAPQDATRRPALYTRMPSLVGSVFIDQALWLGLTLGRSEGEAIGDYNYDGDSDMYLGRPAPVVGTKEFYFRTVRSTGEDAPANRWLAIRLIGGGGNNVSAIGARVKVEAPGQYVQTQVVDGGSGRGGQARQILLFGLGQVNAALTITVTWPDRSVQTVTVPASEQNRVRVVWDMTLPTLLTNTITAFQQPQPGGLTDWVFRWETEYGSRPDLDQVTVWDAAGGQSCSIGTVVLTFYTPGVTVTYAAKPGGGYVHELRWRDQTCVAGCSYRYRVQSDKDFTPPSTHSQAQTLTISVCTQ